MALKAQFAAANSSDLFSPVLFGSDAKKAVVHDEMSLSNQLLVNKRRTLLRFMKKMAERFSKRPVVPKSTIKGNSVPPPTKGLIALTTSSR